MNEGDEAEINLLTEYHPDPFQYSHNTCPSTPLVERFHATESNFTVFPKYIMSPRFPAKEASAEAIFPAAVVIFTNAFVLNLHTLSKMV